MPISDAHSIAQGLLTLRKARHRYLPQGAISEPGWGLLLALFSIDADAGCCGERRLAAIADLAPTTTLRWVQRLEDAGLIRKMHSPTDKRIVRVALTERGRCDGVLLCCRVLVFGGCAFGGTAQSLAAHLTANVRTNGKLPRQLASE
jgi:MarR family